jgi:hypothetical protein
MQEHVYNLKRLLAPVAILAASVNLAQPSEAAVAIGMDLIPVRIRLMDLTRGSDR